MIKGKIGRLQGFALLGKPALFKKKNGRWIEETIILPSGVRVEVEKIKGRKNKSLKFYAPIKYLSTKEIMKLYPRSHKATLGKIKVVHI